MPPTENQEVLNILRGSEITQDAAIQLLELRHQQIKPYLQSVTLQKMTDVRCMQGASRVMGDASTLAYHTVGHDSPVCLSMLGSDRFPEGIFDVIDPGTPLHAGEGKLFIWGLERNSRWVMATVSFTPERNSGLWHHDGQGDYFRVYEVFIETQGLRNTVLGLPDQRVSRLLDLWQKMGDFITQGAANAEKKYRTLQELSARLQFEQELSRSLVSRD